MNVLAPSGIDDIAIVVNEEQWEIGAVLSGYPVCITVDNGIPDALDMVESGLTALPGYTTGVIVVRYDNPPALSESFAALVRFHHQAPHCAVLPKDKGQNGYAALFPIASCHALSQGLTVGKLIPGKCGQLRVVQ